MTRALRSGLMASTSNSLDVLAFAAAFVSGAVLYFSLHFVLALPQWLVSATLIGVMLTYAGVCTAVPRLRVRLDQAGDNAYYLGLLFTLLSMAAALYEFGAATEVVSEGTQPDAIGQIIENFGIALASTITGIFLRVLLQQMRLDPADVERMTRIELAEASKRVRARLDTLTIDLARFHDEVGQRSSDAIASITDAARRSVESLANEAARTGAATIELSAKAQQEMLERAGALGAASGETLSELRDAAERLRQVEAPPVALSRQLERVGKALATAEERSDRLAMHLTDVGAAAITLIERVSEAAGMVRQGAEALNATHATAGSAVQAAAQQIVAALEEIGRGAQSSRELLGRLAEQASEAGAESLRAQRAATDVLTKLAEVTREFTASVHAQGTDGTK